MSKLLYSPNSNILESTYDKVRNADLAINPLFYSVAFTGDGFIYTHGKKFRLFLVNNNEYEGLVFSINNGTADVSIDGVSVGSGTVVQSISGDAIITPTTSNGVVTLTHAKPLNLQTPTQYGSVTKIPVLTIDTYGHITAVSESTIDVTKVKASATTAAGSYYLTGVTNANSQNPKYHSNLYFDGSGNLHAPDIYQNGTAIGSLYAPIAHVSVTANNTTEGHVKLTDTYSSTNDQTKGYAATPKAVQDALTAANTYADNLVAAQDSMIFVGTVKANGTIVAHNSLVVSGVTNNTTKVQDLDYKVGWTFRFTEAGTFGTTEAVEAGDMLIAVKNKNSSFSINDWTIIQTNIDGSLTSSANLSGVLYANNSRNIEALAFSTGVLTYDGSGLAFVNKNTLWRDIKIGTTSIGTNTLTLTQGNYITLSNNNGNVTIAAKASDIIGTAKSFTIKQGANELTYQPSNDQTLNIGSTLALTQSGSDWSLGLATVGSAVSAKLGKITTDAYGRVTAFTEVTTLPNANALKINNNSNTNVFSYTGAAEKVIKILNGTDVSLGLNVNNGVLEITPSITHKYRGIQFYDSESTLVTLLNNSSATNLVLVPGDNISFSNVDSSNQDLPAGNLVINAVDTWRNVEAYSYSANLLSRASIGEASLKFNKDFLFSDNEIGLCWTEIDATGKVTYVC